MTFLVHTGHTRLGCHHKEFAPAAGTEELSCYTLEAHCFLQLLQSFKMYFSGKKGHGRGSICIYINEYIDIFILLR